ncbi:MAG: transglutaminase domain-containing protein [Oscillospiraceae bacterium]|nr:transglutaminase domain-containing protein [Oscillospiraceae bacterium]
MWNGIKLFLTSFVITIIFVCPAMAENVGDVIGTAVGTDIVSYINNYPLPSYNINGRTAVLASDLDGYGFTYNYNNYLRRAELKFAGGDVTPIRFWRDMKTYGQPIADVLYTDIEVYLDGVKIESFNVDGLTAIYFSELAPYGEISFDDGLRSAFLNIPGMKTTEYSQVEDRSTAVASLHYSCYWGTDRYLWDYALMIPVSLYDKYSAIDRNEIGINNYAAYAADPGDDLYISALADCFTRAAEDHGLTDRERLGMAIDFVQSFTYVDDIVAKNAAEYPNFPIETLFEKKGDCEDTAMLLAAILREMGIDAVLLTFISPTGEGHMAVGISGDYGFYGTCYPYNDKLYFYLETTGPGWNVGVVPLEQQGMNAHIIEF